MRPLLLLLPTLLLIARISLAGSPEPAGDPASGHWDLKSPGQFKEASLQCTVSDEFDKDGNWLLLHCKAVLTLVRSSGQPVKVGIPLKQDVNILLRNRDVVECNGDLFINPYDGIRFAVCIYLVPDNEHQLTLYYVAYAGRGRGGQPKTSGITRISDGNWRPDYTENLWPDGQLIGAAHIVKTIAIEKKPGSPR